jgi:hypothetical protein
MERKKHYKTYGAWICPKQIAHPCVWQWAEMRSNSKREFERIIKSKKYVIQNGFKGIQIIK